MVTHCSEYDPFGQIRTQSGSATSDFGYADEQRDAESGLINLRARYHDPALGRFLSRDSLPGAAGAPQTFNRYSYALNNPVGLVDPIGHAADPTFAPDFDPGKKPTGRAGLRLAGLYSRLGMDGSLWALDGKVAVVTGALGRLGPIWIDGLLGSGATVLGLDLAGVESADFDGLRERHPGRLFLGRADIGDRASLVEARREWVGRLGVPDVLVNNAGIDQPPSATAANFRLEDIPLEICANILRVNVLGTFQMTQVFGAEMAAAGRGSIVNIGSLYASVAPDAHFYDHIVSDPPFLKPPAYGASKAAVVNLTRYFATAWGPRGVRVNALSPGGVLGGQDPEFIQKFSARVPLGRMAEPPDLIGPLLFLASDASCYVTGIDLPVEGGFTAW